MLQSRAMKPVAIDVAQSRPVLDAAYRKLLHYLSTAPLATYDIYDFMGVPWIGRLFIKRRQGSRLSGPLIKAVQGAVCWRRSCPGACWGSSPR